MEELALGLAAVALPALVGIRRLDAAEDEDRTALVGHGLESGERDGMVDGRGLKPVHRPRLRAAVLAHRPEGRVHDDAVGAILLLADGLGLGRVGGVVGGDAEALLAQRRSAGRVELVGERLAGRRLDEERAVAGRRLEHHVRSLHASEARRHVGEGERRRIGLVGDRRRGAAREVRLFLVNADEDLEGKGGLDALLAILLDDRPRRGHGRVLDLLVDLLVGAIDAELLGEGSGLHDGLETIGHELLAKREKRIGRFGRRNRGFGFAGGLFLASSSRLLGFCGFTLRNQRHYVVANVQRPVGRAIFDGFRLPQLDRMEADVRLRLDGDLGA